MSVIVEIFSFTANSHCSHILNKPLSLRHATKSVYALRDSATYTHLFGTRQPLDFPHSHACRPSIVVALWDCTTHSLCALKSLLSTTTSHHTSQLYWFSHSWHPYLNLAPFPKMAPFVFGALFEFGSISFLNLALPHCHQLATQCFYFACSRFVVVIFSFPATSHYTSILNQTLSISHATKRVSPISLGFLLTRIRTSSWNLWETIAFVGLYRITLFFHPATSRAHIERPSHNTPYPYPFLVCF